MVGAPLGVLADTINPLTFNATLEVDEEITLTKTVTVSAGGPSSATVDVFFLTDNTGSMGGTINTVRSAATAIMNNVAGLGDVQFGVGQYGGETPIGRIFNLDQQLTSDTGLVQSALNTWIASGGGDGPEANLYGLSRAATDTDWRAGSARILVWFGDYYGHDPSPGGSLIPLTDKVTEADAIADLVAANITTLAFDVGILDLTGQATRIAQATGGEVFSGSINPSNAVDIITAAITDTFNDYSTVSLDLSAVPSGVTVLSTPGSYSGTYDRSIDRTFTFNLTFRGDTPGLYEFDIDALVDGGVVASESDRIRVVSFGGEPPFPPVPEAGSFGATAVLGLAVLAVTRRRPRGNAPLLAAA